jgi:hypothetical protein
VGGLARNAPVPSACFSPPLPSLPSLLLGGWCSGRVVLRGWCSGRVVLGGWCSGRVVLGGWCSGRVVCGRAPAQRTRPLRPLLAAAPLAAVTVVGRLVQREGRVGRLVQREGRVGRLVQREGRVWEGSRATHPSPPPASRRRSPRCRRCCCRCRCRPTARAPAASVAARRHAPTSRRRDEKLRLVTLAFGTARQRMALGRWTNPKPQRRTRSPRYGLPSCRGKSAPTRNPNVTIRTFSPL